MVIVGCSTGLPVDIVCEFVPKIVESGWHTRACQVKFSLVGRAVAGFGPHGFIS